MRKYLFILKSELMSDTQYVFNVLAGFIGYLTLLFIFFNLWQYIYSDPNELINGYNMNQMIWYVIITEILWMSLSGRKLCQRISDDVKGGNIAYNMNKPYSYIGYILSSHLGSMIIRSFIYSSLSMACGFLFLGWFPNINILSGLAIVLTMILATFISIFLITTLGLLAFVFEDSAPFYWLYSKLILVVGTLFPIEYFPLVFQPILRYSPIYVVSYGPAKLFVDFSWNSFISVIITQIIYIFITYSICLFTYKKGVKRLNVNGG